MLKSLTREITLSIQAISPTGVVGLPATMSVSAASGSLTVNPAVQAVGATGQSGLTTTVAASGAWTASSSESFVTITGGASGSGG